MKMAMVEEVLRLPSEEEMEASEKDGEREGEGRDLMEEAS